MSLAWGPWALALGFSLTPLAARAEGGLTPVQAEVAVETSMGPEPTHTVAAFAGWVLSRKAQALPLGFLAGGLEVTWSSLPDPYRSSFGLQLRGGLAWGQATSRLGVLPDFFVFARVTPFLGQSGGMGAPAEKDKAALHGEPTRLLGGVRLGVGLTALGWTRTFFSQGLYAESPGFYGETMRMLSVVMMLPVALLNHLELVFEARTPALDVAPMAVFLRVGAGV